MANSDKNILITPSVGLSTNPTIKFNGANNTPTTLRVLDDGTISFEATAGQLFSISDGLTGSIFSVNDISGIPSIEVLDTGLVKLNQYGGSTVFGASSAIQNGSSVNAKVSISTVSATTPGLIIKGISSQTANLQEWQNSAGTVLVNVTSSGHLSVSDRIYGGNGVSVFNASSFGSPSLFPPFTYDSIVNISTVYAGAIGLVIRGVASQTNDLQQWRNSAGTVLASINSSGYINSSGGIKASTHGYIYTSSTQGSVSFMIADGNAAYVPLVIKGAASQSANLQEWQNSSGTLLAKIANNGRLTIKPIPFSGGVSGGIYLGDTSNAWVDGAFEIKVDNAGTPRFGFTAPNAATEALTINGNSVGVQTTSPSAVFQVTSNAAGNIASIIKGATSQTANLQEWQNSSGTVLAYVEAGGHFGVGNLFSSFGGSATKLGYVTVSGSLPAIIPLVIRGAASQTANLQEWQDSTGTANSWITASGSNLGFTLNTGWNINWGNTPILSMTSAGLVVNPYNATRQALVVKGAASQTANLQEWQDSSGTVLTTIDSSGKFVIGRGAQLASAVFTVQGNTSTYSPDNTSALANRIIFLRGNTGGNLMALASKGDAAQGVAALAITNGGFSTEIIGFGYNGNIYTNIQSASTVGLTIKGAASQTADLQQWQDSAGTVLARVYNNGVLSVGSLYAATGDVSVAYGGYFGGGTAGGYIGAAVSVIPWTTAVVGVIVRGRASQTADLQQWQDSAGTVLAGVNAARQIYAGTTASINGSTTTAITSAAFTSATVAVFTYGGTSLVQAGQRVTVAGVTGGTYNGTWTVTAVTSTTFTVLGSGFTDVAGTGGTFTLSAVGSFVASTAAITPIVVRGAASQTANLQQWQDSAGTVLSSVDNNGNGRFPIIASTIGSLTNMRTNFDTNGIGFVIAGAAQKGIVVRGAASQTANLQEWQDSSGTVLSSITNNGFLNTPAILENPTISATAATGTINYDLLTNKSVTYYTSNASANWTLNIRGNSSTTLDSLMAVGQSLTIAFLVTQGSTAYYQSGLQIDGTSVTPKWQGGVAPTFGNASGVDSYSITIMKTASATFTVFESQTRFA